MENVTTPLVSPPIAATPQVAGQIVYASFGKRFLAMIIDSLILGVINGVLGAASGAFTGGFAQNDATGSAMMISGLLSLVQIVINIGYAVYFIGSKGQTLGKTAMRIKVVDAQTHAVPGYSVAFLRETVGKFISGIILCIGYLAMLWDIKKQTWHDKIAHTIVIEIP